MARKKKECYPDFSAEIEAIRKNGIDAKILSRIIRKHSGNSRFNRKLCERYQVVEDGVPIFRRRPRFEKGNQLNNRLNNDFFSEIVDFKTGYIAGKPISYSYSKTKESEAETGSKEKTDAAGKALTDFVAYANMYDADMQCVKYAAICGYGVRLFYIDKRGKENVMSILPYQAALLYDTDDMSDPEFGVRYYKTRDMHDAVVCKAEFYDSAYVYSFSGGSFDTLEQTGQPKPHMFGGCPLQGVPNNVVDNLGGIAEPVDKQIRQTIEDTYTACYDGMVNAVKQSTARNVSLQSALSGLSATTPEAIKNVVENPMDKLTLSTVLNRRRTQIVTSAKKTLAVGLASGESHADCPHRGKQSH